MTGFLKINVDSRTNEMSYAEIMDVAISAIASAFQLRGYHFDIGYDPNWVNSGIRN
ncbi:MAG: hypothetical protein IKR72_03050 [Bacteroidales bacterium]|nr:hypothetical protein [Bacteroidales bacterium]